MKIIHRPEIKEMALKIHNDQVTMNLQIEIHLDREDLSVNKYSKDAKIKNQQME